MIILEQIFLVENISRLGSSRNTLLLSCVTSSIIAVMETCNKPRAIRVFTKMIYTLSKIRLIR